MIGKIVIAEGTEGVKVNAIIAVLLDEGESGDDIVAASTAAEASPTPAAEVSTPLATAAAPAAPVVDLSPDYPEGTPMKSQTVREALRDAMSEEMRANEDVYLMGEEVAEYQGAYKVSQGMLDELRSSPCGSGWRVMGRDSMRVLGKR